MISVDVKRSIFYSELSAEQQKYFFDCKQKKYLPNIDNIYYTVSIFDDESDNTKLLPLFAKLDELKRTSIQTRESAIFDLIDGLELRPARHEHYSYCLYDVDLYDIYISDYLPNEATPRFVVQIRSYGLWLYGWEHMLEVSFSKVRQLCNIYGVDVSVVMENRIDYCYHTNILKEPEKVFSDLKLKNSLRTNLERYNSFGYVRKFEDGRTELTKDYFALGSRKSNNVYVRFYNKTLEVIEKGYKGYFFEIWLNNGLINNYDLYCYEYAYLHKDYNYIYAAQLEFYLLHGTDEALKLIFDVALKNNVHSEIKSLAKKYMPSCTKIFNIEYQTKRKFYSYSDQQIDSLFKVKNRDYYSFELRRLYKIFDNRGVFIDYLTSTCVSFVHSNDNNKYLDFWQRLRHVKLDCFDVDVKLVRDYSNKLDKDVVLKRFINNVATNSIYQGKTDETDFFEDIDDIVDLLSCVNDNDKHDYNFSFSDFNSSYFLRGYKSKKTKDFNRLRNRLEQDTSDINLQTQTSCSDCSYYLPNNYFLFNCTNETSPFFWLELEPTNTCDFYKE